MPKTYNTRYRNVKSRRVPSGKKRIFEVESILGKKTENLNGRDLTLYYIKWLGYDDSYNTWEPVTNLSCPIILESFEESQKETPKAEKVLAISRRRKRKLHNFQDGEEYMVSEAMCDMLLEFKITCLLSCLKCAK
jgi:hypothetical protein